MDAPIGVIFEAIPMCFGLIKATKCIINILMNNEFVNHQLIVMVFYRDTCRNKKRKVFKIRFISAKADRQFSNL